LCNIEPSVSHQLR